MALDRDEELMARAVAIAGRGLWTTAPNPRVGCVLVREGAVIAEGPSDVVAADRHVIEAYLGAHYVPVDE